MKHPLPVLYSFRRCPYAIRARLAIAVSQYPCHLREVLLRNKPEAMIAASPKATVPVMVKHDGKVIDESLDIMLLVLGQSDPQNWLSPEEGSIADMLGLIEQTEIRFKIHLDRYKYANRYPDEDPETHRQAAFDFLMELDARLAKSPNLFGSKKALADFAILPFVRQFAQTDRRWFDGVNWPNLSAWLRGFEGSSLFASVMTKYPVWQPGDIEPIFPQVP